MAKKPFKRLPELDIVRALAMCLIVVGHSFFWLAIGPKPITDPYSTFTIIGWVGYLLLALFFFVSGFALYRNNQFFSTWHDVTGFFRKRALRIFPLYWVALSAYVIFFEVLPLKTLAAGYNPADIVFYYDRSVSDILVYILGLQGLIETRSISVGYTFPALWFVGVILVYYAVYPLIIAFSSRITKFIAISGLVFLALSALQLVIHTIVPELLIFYGVFVGGVFASKYALVDKLALQMNKVNYMARLITSVTAAAIPCVGWAFLRFFFVRSGVAGNIGFVVAANGLLFLFALFAVTGVKILATSPRDSSYQVYRLIAYSSYSIYLFHLPVMMILGFALMYWLKLSVLEINAILILLGLPCLFVICYFIQTWQDIALKRFINRRRAKQS